MSEEKNVKIMIEGEEEKPRIEGVGVIYYPEKDLVYPDGTKRFTRDEARMVAAQIIQGSIIALPSTRDANGHLLWDFKIEGGDPGQVEVRRMDGIDEPIIVEQA